MELVVAADTGDLAAVQALLARGIDPNARAPWCQQLNCGVTALHCAARSGHVQIVEALLAASARVDEADVEGWTALHYAAHADVPGAVRALLDHGADPTKTERRWRITARDIARRRRFGDIVAMLPPVEHLKRDEKSGAGGALRPLFLNRYLFAEEGVAQAVASYIADHDRSAAHETLKISGARDTLANKSIWMIFSHDRDDHRVSADEARACGVLMRDSALSPDAFMVVERERRWQDIKDALVEVSPERHPAVGDYVCATKYGDADPGDRWGVGLVSAVSDDRVLFEETGALTYRCFARVTRDEGEMLLRTIPDDGPEHPRKIRRVVKS